MKICEAGKDSCRCKEFTKGIRTINNQYPDDNRDFDINAGDGIEITPATAGITIAVKAPLPGPMVFRGTVGTGGTIASLPPADPDNQGDTYIAVSSAVSPVTYNAGDVLISDGYTWSVVPSGDDIIPIVTAWQTPPDDAHVPSEKLVKDSIDAITIPIVTAWQTPPDDAHVPSEKLVKDNLDTKLDKITSGGPNRVYGIDGNGNQTLFYVYDTANEWTLARRISGGALVVGTPTADNHATTKKYVDDNIYTSPEDITGYDASSIIDTSTVITAKKWGKIAQITVNSPSLNTGNNNITGLPRASSSSYTIVYDSSMNIIGHARITSGNTTLTIVSNVSTIEEGDFTITYITQ